MCLLRLYERGKFFNCVHLLSQRPANTCLVTLQLDLYGVDVSTIIV